VTLGDNPENCQSGKKTGGGPEEGAQGGGSSAGEHNCEIRGFCCAFRGRKDHLETRWASLIMSHERDYRRENQN